MREKNVIIAVLLAGILLGLLNLPERFSGMFKSAARDLVAPLQEAATALGRSVHETLLSIRGIGGLYGENRRMAEELARLRNEIRALRGLESENLDLREQLDFTRTVTRQLIPCEIISRDMGGWWQAVRLNKGALDGITPNLAVITPEGLAGKTTSVSPHTCDVLLLSDPGCRVSARISRTGIFGVVSGRGAPEKGVVTCRMDFLNKTLPVKPGDEVVTSGLGGVFPRGLLIGYADRALPDETGLYQTADIVPAADVGALNYLFVVALQADEIEELHRRKVLSEGVAP